MSEATSHPKRQNTKVDNHVVSHFCLSFPFILRYAIQTFYLFFVDFRSDIKCRVPGLKVLLLAVYNFLWKPTVFLKSSAECTGATW